MKQRMAGIYKGVSEAVYPNEILGDQELQGADLATRGAWCAKILPIMWRDKANGGNVTDTLKGFAQFWGCSVREVSRIIGVIEARKIGIVSRDCHNNVTITCRRLSRRYKAREEARLRKQRERERRTGHASVTGQKPPPSSSSSFSSSVPVDVNPPLTPPGGNSEPEKSVPEPLPIPKELKGLFLYEIDKKLIKAWPELFPALKMANPGIDVVQQTANAHTWEVANPSRRKRDRPKFLANWMARSQDEGKGMRDGRSRKGSRRYAAADEQKGKFDGIGTTFEV